MQQGQASRLTATLILQNLSADITIIISSSTYIYILKTEYQRTSVGWLNLKTDVLVTICMTTRCRNPEYHNLNPHRHENLKSQIITLFNLAEKKIWISRTHSMFNYGDKWQKRKLEVEVTARAGGAEIPKVFLSSGSYKLKTAAWNISFISGWMP
jgi:hypothetical protein